MSFSSGDLKLHQKKSYSDNQFNSCSMQVKQESTSSDHFYRIQSISLNDFCLESRLHCHHSQTDTSQQCLFINCDNRPMKTLINCEDKPIKKLLFQFQLLFYYFLKNIYLLFHTLFIYHIYIFTIIYLAPQSHNKHCQSISTRQMCI